MNREDIARIICYWDEPSTCHDNYCVWSCRAKVPDERFFKAADQIITWLQDDLITKTEISGPAVDALENRKESDDGPTEQEVNDQLREYLNRPVCTCMDQASVDYCLNKDKCRAMPRSFKDLDMLGLL